MNKDIKNKKANLKKILLNEKNFQPLVDKTFNDSDTNKSGFIEKKELTTLLKSIYATVGLHSPPEEDIIKEFKRLDKNDDNKISKEEFSILIKDLCLFFIDQSY